MATQNPGSKWIHRYAILVSVSTFCLIIAGGLVTSTDSGLAVPDWPLSYGQLMPPMVGGIFYEHGHRMVATFVGFLTTILAFWLWKTEDRRWVRTLGWIALGAVITQGVLGGLTVLFLLPTGISVAHATLAQSFFCLTVIIAMVTSPSFKSYRAPEFAPAVQTRKLAIFTTGAIFLQLVLGALMRHTKSGMAIPDFPLVYGGLIPPIDPGAMESIKEYRLYFDLPAVELYQLWIHFAHRVGALIAAVLVMLTVSHTISTYRSVQKMREPALLLVVLLVMQVLLGALTVWSGKSIEVTTAHVAMGALLLGASVAFTARVFHLYRVPSLAPALEAVAEGGRP